MTYHVIPITPVARRRVAHTRASKHGAACRQCTFRRGIPRQFTHAGVGVGGALSGCVLPRDSLSLGWPLPAPPRSLQAARWLCNSLAGIEYWLWPLWRYLPGGGAPPHMHVAKAHHLSSPTCRQSSDAAAGRRCTTTFWRFGFRVQVGFIQPQGSNPEPRSDSSRSLGLSAKSTTARCLACHLGGGGGPFPAASRGEPRLQG